MTVDYGKHNLVTTLIAAAVPDVVSLPEKINTSPCTYAWCVLIDLANAIHLGTTTGNLFLVGKANSLPLLFSLRDTLTLWPCVITKLEGILMSFSSIQYYNITLMHCIDYT